MESELVKFNFRPGFNKNSTDYDLENHWVDGDKVRFRNGRAEKIGGWSKSILEQANNSSVTTFTGVTRAAHSWVDLNYNKYLCSSNHLKLEILNDDTVYDITPYRAELSLTDVITTVSGESEVTITHLNHSLKVGDFVFVDSQASAVDGITLSGEYTVLEIVDSSNFKIDSGTNATGSTSAAGGLLEINYLLETGYQDNGDLTGYSGGTWNTPGISGQGYNRPRAGVGGLFLREWSLDNWGEDLIACVRNGRIYQWDATNDVTTRAQVISNAPTENFLIMVAQPSRHLVAFGTQEEISGNFDPLTIRWASQETLTQWDSTADGSNSGEYRLPLGNYIVGAIQTRSEILVFTDRTVYSMRFVGGDNVFQFTILADNITAISQNCFVDVNGIVYWMGIDNFYMYDGVVRVLPCDLEEFIFDQDGGGQINYGQKEKVYCSTINSYNEIIWFYPSTSDTENNRYIIYNYKDGVWYDGTITRTCWVDSTVFEKPFGFGVDGSLFVHEQGYDDDGSPMYSWIQSGDVDIKDGTSFFLVDRFIPDFELRPNRNAQLTLNFKKYPSDSGIEKGPYTFSGTTRKISVRGRGRHVSIKYEVNSLGADFDIGAPRLGITLDARR